MENASKALMMAGGVLLAIITISVFYYMFSQISTFRSEIEEDPTAAALLSFNQGFEAYNKKIMYGTDIISVLNKAIDNNRTYDVETGYEGPYYVNVVFILASDLETRVENYKLSDSGVGYEKTTTDNVDTVFRANTEYSLRNDGDKIKSLIINAASWTDTEEDKTYNNAESSISTYTPGCKSYTVTYYPAAEFKRRIFYCSGADYDDGTGRLIQMTFIEKN